MIYPANFEVKSGFATIRSLLHQQCLVNYSHELVDSISYTSNFNQLNKLLGQVAEMKYILQFVAGFPQQDYYDLTSELIRIRVRGTYLESSTLPELKLSLEAITAIITFISNLEPGKFNEIRNLLPIGKPEKYIIDRINKIVDEKGDIRDHASEKLSVIRKEIKSRTSSIDRRINQILGQARKDNLVNDDTELTIRNGRLVIPLPAGNKRKLKGYVHDTSATGQTVFIEPAEVFEINNDIQNLRVEEKQEIINILTEFTDFIRGYVDELLVYYRFLGEIDFIRAKALLAIDFQATKPELINAPRIEWRNAVHPILHKTLQKQGKSIVAQDISLDNNERIMVISGPNAGGKSVTLKTIALLQYM
ncbi:MAG: endonuclease MutS2, partial [Omnitrophica WOR_2 bacterium]